MAAAEYYNPAGNQGPPPGPQYHPQQQAQGPPPPPSQVTPPYPMSDAPPPYTAFQEPRPHSQPPPQQRPAYPSAPGSYGPQASSQYPPEKSSRLQHMYRPSDFASPYSPSQRHPSPQPPPQSYLSPQGAPAMQKGYGDNRRPSSTPAYPPQQEYRPREARSRSRSRDRRHHYSSQRPQSSRKKPSGVSTFLGAGGGALVGDLIFPGLGTIGGALLGGVGGHEYGKQKRSYSSSNKNRPRAYSNDDGHYDDYRRGRK